MKNKPSMNELIKFYKIIKNITTSTYEDNYRRTYHKPNVRCLLGDHAWGKSKVEIIDEFGDQESRDVIQCRYCGRYLGEDDFWIQRAMFVPGTKAFELLHEIFEGDLDKYIKWVLENDDDIKFWTLRR